MPITTTPGLLLQRTQQPNGAGVGVVLTPEEGALVVFIPRHLWKGVDWFYQLEISFSAEKKSSMRRLKSAEVTQLLLEQVDWNTTQVLTNWLKQISLSFPMGVACPHFLEIVQALKTAPNWDSLDWWSTSAEFKLLQWSGWLEPSAPAYFPLSQKRTWQYWYTHPWEDLTRQSAVVPPSNRSALKTVVNDLWQSAANLPKHEG